MISHHDSPSRSWIQDPGSESFDPGASPGILGASPGIPERVLGSRSESWDLGYKDRDPGYKVRGSPPGADYPSCIILYISAGHPR